MLLKASMFNPLFGPMPNLIAAPVGWKKGQPGKSTLWVSSLSMVFGFLSNFGTNVWNETSIFCHLREFYEIGKILHCPSAQKYFLVGIVQTRLISIQHITCSVVSVVAVFYPVPHRMKALKRLNYISALYQRKYLPVQYDVRIDRHRQELLKHKPEQLPLRSKWLQHRQP